MSSKLRENCRCCSEKEKRADSKDVARIALEDLAKYFDLPIVEASRNLNVGLTVLKRKCREFGIPRWPHRKIKSLDGLIRDLLSLSLLLSFCLKNIYLPREGRLVLSYTILMVEFSSHFYLAAIFFERKRLKTQIMQEEAEQRQQDEAVAYAVAKRRMMLETEKESIEKEPFIKLKSETKRCRQDIFKRRHKARALKN